ncbi:MAG: hypothetical protein KF687_11935 [Cyclobacteriaceae bacterium]|nr:hypothetical protein [Cyclobacteriaceae bacterium]
MKRFKAYLLLVLVVACSTEENPRIADEKYFPLQIGFYQVYDVEEIVYTAFNPPESLRYELLVNVVDAFTNGEGTTTYVIHRSTRSHSSLPWNFVETWSARRSSQYAIEVQGNTSYVKLVFPLRTGNRWDGNLFNSLGEDEYLLKSMGQTFDNGSGEVFSNTIVVEHSNESNLVFKDERTEVYAPDAGLVFKENRVWQYNCTGGTCSGQINSGRYLKQVLVAYGY